MVSKRLRKPMTVEALQVKGTIDDILKARRGEQCAQKLTESQAREILQRIRKAQAYHAEALLLSNKALGEKFGIDHKSVGRIVHGHRWVQPTNKYHGEMTFEDAVLIRQAAAERDRLKSLAAEHSCRQLAEEYGVSVSCVEQIGSGRRWVYVYADEDRSAA